MAMGPAKTSKKSSPNSKVGGFLSKIREEIKLVTWPTKDEVIKSTTTVIMVTIIVAICVYAADNLFGAGFRTFILKQ